MNSTEYLRKLGNTFSALFKASAICAIRSYQILISPLLGPNCRFEPTCSNYAKQAFETHNLSAATYLATKRLCRCHPWGGHGYDPVPLKGINS